MPNSAESALEVRFGAHTMLLDASGALFWPQENLLAAADLHFEKASFLAGAGNPVPPYDTTETLRLLTAKVAQYQPKTLLLLGDSFHDRDAFVRMTPADRAMLSAVVAQVEHCLWIEGNHDASSLPETGLHCVPHHAADGLHFCHQPDTALPFPQLVGHYHPKASVRLRGHKIGGRCFVQSRDLIVLPAFGAFTGGLNIDSAAFQTVLNGQEHRVYLCHRTTVYRLR